MTDQKSESLSVDSQPQEEAPAVLDERQNRRRDFLITLGRWSKAVIGGVLLGGALAPGRDAKALGWANGSGRDGSWVNLGGGGWGWGGGWGGGWYNGGWYDRPWYNRPWYNRPWYNRPWYNGGWYNGPGRGGSWYNGGSGSR